MCVPSYLAWPVAVVVLRYEYATMCDMISIFKRVLLSHFGTTEVMNERRNKSFLQTPDRRTELHRTTSKVFSISIQRTCPLRYWRHATHHQSTDCGQCVAEIHSYMYGRAPTKYAVRVYLF